MPTMFEVVSFIVKARALRFENLTIKSGESLIALQGLILQSKSYIISIIAKRNWRGITPCPKNYVPICSL
jgi:hypothetical protein